MYLLHVVSTDWGCSGLGTPWPKFCELYRCRVPSVVELVEHLCVSQSFIFTVKAR